MELNELKTSRGIQPKVANYVRLDKKTQEKHSDHVDEAATISAFTMEESPQSSGGAPVLRSTECCVQKNKGIFKGTHHLLVPLVLFQNNTLLPDHRRPV